jgi:hypothetical protein
MGELIRRVSDKTGLSEDMAKSAVEAVSDYLKDRPPAPIAWQVKRLIEGSGEGRGGILGGSHVDASGPFHPSCGSWSPDGARPDWRGFPAPCPPQLGCRG